MKSLIRSSSSALMLSSLALSGCAIVSSTKMSATNGGFGGTGIPYLLPKALVPIEVVASGPEVRVDLLEPVYVGDAAHSYALRYDASPFSSDTVNITVDPTTSLLKTIAVESKDESGEILKKAVATLRAESASGTETVLMQTLLDPGDLDSIKEVEARVKATLDSFVARQRRTCTDATTKPDGCGEILALPASTESRLSVTLMSQAPQGAAVGVTQIPGASPAGVDCRVGICYRGTLPYRLSIEALGQTRSTLVNLPNHGPLMALPLSRHAFVTSKHTVGLRNGMLESYAVDKPSSALAVVSWPLEAYDAIATTTAKILQLKIDTSRASVGLQEQLLAEVKKRKEIEDELERLKSPKAESAGLIGMGGSPRTILTLRIGQRKVIPATGAGMPAPIPTAGAVSAPSLPGSNGTGVR